MGLLRMEKWMCPDYQHCFQLVANYLGSKRSAFSLALGLISVLSWGVAEIPQLITNFKKKSAEGLSIWFLMTWILGYYAVHHYVGGAFRVSQLSKSCQDLLNLFGCLLEPGTLPTQYYTAMLYTVTTLFLFSQVLYYGHLYPRMKATKMQQEDMQADAVDRTREDNRRVDAEKVVVKRCTFAPTLPIPFPSASPNTSEELYFMSARSLSVSNTPIVGSFKSPRTLPSDLERNLFREPLLEVLPAQSAPPAQIKTMLCVVSVITFLICSSNHQLAETHKNVISRGPTRGILLPLGRQLLEVKISGGSTLEISVDKSSSSIGSILGWGMALIYLGGRLPQICLNIRRGHAEGLNPLMFIFALVGNATYVASILVNSTDWLKIRSNLPWLVDAGGCLLLDTFFSYYRYRSGNEAEKHVS